jgi:2-polyprenyl-6-methoxyphenol hydroxylase-like FAD-dependent oxidoreductase
MVIGGWLATGKLVIYPIRDPVDEHGNQLINWVAEIQFPGSVPGAPDRDFNWNRPGRLEDLLPRFAGWRLDWLDVHDLFGSAETIIECPMVDREPLPWWTQGRVTLLGDAAHPMYPRGSNGAGQAILDARALAGCLKREPSQQAALLAYQSLRLAPANQVVIGSRSICPDTILRRVYERTGDRPFDRIEDVIAQHEIVEITETYKRLAGFERESLISRASLLA